MNAGAWMRGNLTTQGYRLSDAERRQLAVGVRFSTGLCLTLVVVVGTLLAAGAATAALVLGGMLVAACALVTTTNLCLPSETFAWLERRRAAESITT